jgi:carotenoid cleavage dioxygenase-like enzyme
MKQLSTLILVAACLFYASCSPATFATVGNNDWKVTLYHYSPDVKIQENGRDCIMVRAFAAHKKAGYSQNIYVGGLNGSSLYTDGIQLDRTTLTHTITLSKNGKTASVTIEKSSKPFIDVTAALGESKELDFAALQNQYLKDQKKKK